MAFFFHSCRLFDKITYLSFGLSVILFYLISTHLSNVTSPINFLSIQEDEFVIDNHFDSDNSSQLSLTQELFDYLSVNLHDTPYAGVGNYTQYQVARFNLKTLDNVRPIRPEFGPVINDYTSFNYLINTSPCDDKKSVDHSNKSSVFVAIVSAAGHTVKRATIRRTWKQHLHNQVVTDLIEIVGFAFFMGKTDNKQHQDSINGEHDNFSDIVQIDMIDTYNNLTLKYVATLNWLMKYCPSVDYVLKVDDDVYVNVRNVAATIRTLTPSRQSIYGKQVGGNRPMRTKGAKWAYSFETWPWSHLPRFVAGLSSILSGNAVAPLLGAAQTTPFFVSDDLYVSGLCNRKANVSIGNSNTFASFDIPNGGRPDGCFVNATCSWLTESAAQMNVSHEMTEKFYANLVRCETSNPSTNSSSLPQNSTSEMTDFVASSFDFIPNLE